MKKVFLSILLFVATGLSLMAQDYTVLENVPSLNSVFDKAKSENKLILVECYSTDCLPCNRMDKEALTNELVAREIHSSFIFLKVNVFNEKLGDTLNTKFSLSDYPSFLILNSDGRLVSMLSGFKDAGQFMNELDRAIIQQVDGSIPSGFTSDYSLSYPEYYKEMFKNQHKPLESSLSNAWIKTQKDWTTEAVALSIFNTTNLDAKISKYFIDNYVTYRVAYGQSLSVPRAASLLNAQLNKLVGSKRNDEYFWKLLKKTEFYFPLDDLYEIQFLLGENYFNSIVKDTLAFLEFTNRYPFIYKSYFASIYNNMVARNQVGPKELAYFCTWADKGINAEAAFELIIAAASIHKKNNDIDGFKKFMNMAISKAKKYKVPAEPYEKMLSEN